MSNQSQAPGGPANPAEAWEEETSQPLLAEKRNKRLGGAIVIGAVAVAALGIVYAMRNGAAPANGSEAGDYQVAARTPVPPLPAQHTASAPAPAPQASAPAPTPATQNRQPDQLEQQRQLQAMQRAEQERKMAEARLKSDIMGKVGTGMGVRGGDGSATPGAAPSFPGTYPSAAAAAAAGGLGGSSGGERGAQDTNSRFARAVSGGGVPVSRAGQIQDLEYKILQGKSVDGKTIQAANSDLPALLCAQVDSDTFAEQGRLVLIPWGSRVCGTYNAELRKGQTRLFVVWQYLRRPDGVEVALNSAGGDQLGQAGMGGYVDTHFAQIFGASALISIIGAGAANAGVGGEDRYNSGAEYRNEVQRAASQTSRTLLEPYINMPPTVTVPPGSRVRIFVNRDLDFSELLKPQQEAQEAGPVVGDVFSGR